MKNNEKNKILPPQMEKRGSIYVLAEQRAHEHKWIESEKARRDLGDAALFDWYHRYWWTFCRERLIEHLLGAHYWVEIDDNDNFGLVKTRFAPDDPIILAIIDIFQRGGENLDVVQYALANHLNLDEILLRLEIFDINSLRLTPNITITEKEFIDNIKTNRNRCALVVDNDPATRQTIREILDSKKIICHENDSAEAAFDLISKRYFDIFFIGLNLPGRLGTEIADRLRRHGCKVPVAALNNSSTDWYADDLLDCGFTDILYKPLNHTQVDAVLNKMKP